MFEINPNRDVALPIEQGDGLVRFVGDGNGQSRVRVCNIGAPIASLSPPSCPVESSLIPVELYSTTHKGNFSFLAVFWQFSVPMDADDPAIRDITPFGRDTPKYRPWCSAVRKICSNSDIHPVTVRWSNLILSPPSCGKLIWLSFVW